MDGGAPWCGFFLPVFQCVGRRGEGPSVARGFVPLVLSVVVCGCFHGCRWLGCVCRGVVVGVGG